MIIKTDEDKKVSFFDSLYYSTFGKYKVIYNPYSYKGPLVLPKKIFLTLKKFLNGKYKAKEIKEKIKEKLNLNNEKLLHLIRQLNGYDLLSYDAEKNHIHINPNLDRNEITFWVDLTNQCNFRCTYCYIERKKEIINPEKFELLLDKLINYINKYSFRKVKFFLAGGEPLLYFDNFKKIVLTIKRFEKKYSHLIKTEIYVITNGSLLTEDKAKYLKDEKIKVAISCDGLEKFHNKTRKFINGEGTFKYVFQGIQLAKKYNILNNVIVTITSKNIINLPDYVSFLLNNKIGFELQFYRVLSPFCLEEKLRFSNLTIKKYIETIRVIYDFYKKNSKKNIRVKNKMPIMLLDQKTPFSISRYSCGAGYNYFTITSNCEIKVCPASNIKIPFDKISNFLIRIKKISRFINYPIDNNPVCNKCLWKYLCRGGCKLEKFFLKNNNIDFNYCRFYKKIISYLIFLEVEDMLSQNFIKK